MKTKMMAGLGMGALTALTYVVTAAQDQAADPNKTYKLEARYSVGDLLRYKMQMTMNMEMKPEKGDSPIPPIATTVNAIMRMKTAGIRPDGTAVVVSRVEEGKSVAMGKEVDMKAMPETTMEIDRRGMMKMHGLENAPGMQALGKIFNMNQLPSMGAILPDHLVKVGESWESEMPTPFGKAKVNSTLLGEETVGGVPTVKIKQAFTMPMSMQLGQDGQPTKDAANAMMVMAGTITSNGIMNIVPDTARLIKSVADMGGEVGMEIKGAAASQSPFGSKLTMKMNGNIVFDLLSAGKVEAPAVPAKKPAAAAKKG